MLKIIRRLRDLLRQGRVEAELREEMEFHRALRLEHLEASGVPDDEAVYASCRALGNTTLAREDARAVWICPRLESVWRDVVHAFRSLRREPAFTLIGIPIRAGRNFEPSDVKRDVILIGESMARRLWPNGSAVGRTLQLGESPQQATSRTGDRQIVGVVKDVDTYYGNVTTAFPTVYEPIAGRTIPRLIVRHLDPGLTQALTALAQRIEPRSRLVATTVFDNLDQRLAPSVVAAWVAGVLGLLAATLAGIGIFSVFAYAVEQRRSEVGIRLALGARPSQIVRALLASNSGAVLLGVTFGAAGAVAASQVLRNQLHGLSPFDPIAYAVVAAVLAIIAVAATIVPARRTTRIDPIAALRCG